MEAACDATTCQKYDFSLAKDLIDLVVGQGKANLWVVLGPPSNYKFTDGKKRENGTTYLPNGPISRQAHKDYLTALVNYATAYGRQVSGDSGWHVASWNLYNEVSSEYKSTFNNDIDKATTAYADFVIDSSKILRKLTPQSEIVLAGTGSGTDLKGGHGEFYKLVFSKLKQANLDYSPFDYWESHWFGEFDNYQTNEKDYSAKYFIKFLQENGYGDKKFLIRAGGTYSGQDLQERKGLMDNEQSERDQAEFLVKRFVYNLANGVKKIPWSTIYERAEYQGENHVQFQYVSLIYDGTPDGVSKNQKCVDGWLPCPDPGRGVKKLSYFAYKKLIEVSKGKDWSKIEALATGVNDVYSYKIVNGGKTNYFTWWDWWNKCPRPNLAKPGMDTACINKYSPTLSIAVDDNTPEVKITEAIPDFATGQEVDNAGYAKAFKTYTISALNGKAEIPLGIVPLYVTYTGNPPVITSALTSTGTIGTAFSYQITATNSPTSFNAAGLPAGLSVSTGGLISGTPSTIGTSSVTISATNAGGTGSAGLTLSVYSACDVNRDGSTNVVDVQLQVNQALGVAACTSDLNRDGFCNVIDVQRGVNAGLGGQCVLGP